MKLSLALGALSLITPIITMLLVPPFMNAIKAMNAAIDRLPDTIKRGVIVVFSAAITVVGDTLATEFPKDLHEWTTVTVKAFIGALLAFIAHNAKKTKALAEPKTGNGGATPAFPFDIPTGT